MDYDAYLGGILILYRKRKRTVVSLSQREYVFQPVILELGGGGDTRGGRVPQGRGFEVGE